MAPRKRVIAPHRFRPRRRSLGQELRLIANRSSLPGTGSELSPIRRHRKRRASVDNSQLDRCTRNLDTLCSNPRKVHRLARQKSKTNRPCSIRIKGSSPLPKTAPDLEPRKQHLSAIEQKVSDFILQASSPRAVISPDPFTRSEMIAVHQALLQVPGLGGHSSRRTHKLNAPTAKTSSRSAKHNALPSNPPPSVRLSLSPTAIKNPPFNAFFNQQQQQVTYAIASPKVMTPSPTDPVVNGLSAAGILSPGTKSPVTPQNVPAATRFFPVFGHYLPAANTAQGYYVQQINATQTAYPQYGNHIGPFYPASIQNRQFHQVASASGTPLGQCHPSYEGLLQPGSYVGSLTPNNLFPSLPVQNNQLYYQIPTINTTPEYSYIPASNSPVYAQKLYDQTAWNPNNRLASPDPPTNGHNQSTPLKPMIGQPVDIYQQVQLNGTNVSPSRLPQFVYQTPNVTLAMNNGGGLYQINSAQSVYQTNCDGLKVAGQPGSLHSPKIHNVEQGLPFILSSGVGPPPKKKMATGLGPQTTERPRIHPLENQWLSASGVQWQRNL